MSYSQNDEEKYILESCKGTKRRRFLDIGAFDPKCMSNTRALFEMGWSGVMIEPSPKCVRELVKEYGNQPGMSVICAAVATDQSIVSIMITDDAVSGENPSQAWLERGGYLGRMLIHAITIPQILDRFGAFDFVSIDTEGTSVDLLKVLLATEMFPQCICVEHDNRWVEATANARARGYKPVYESAENLVFSL